jgi:hypothetical protein
MTTITVIDETMTGNILRQTTLDMPDSVTTVQDLIIARVTQEVEKYNKSKEEFLLNGLLVRPTDAEVMLNHKPQPHSRVEFFEEKDKKLKKHLIVDVEKQCYIALDAFQKNGFMMLIDNRQAEDLLETVLIQPKTVLSFIKLTALVGG